MLKNKTTGQDRQCFAIDRLRIDRDNRDAEEIPDRAEKALLVYFPGIKHVTRP